MMASSLGVLAKVSPRAAKRAWLGLRNELMRRSRNGRHDGRGSRPWARERVPRGEIIAGSVSASEGLGDDTRTIRLSAQGPRLFAFTAKASPLFENVTDFAADGRGEPILRVEMNRRQVDLPEQVEKLAAMAVVATARDSREVQLPG